MRISVTDGTFDAYVARPSDACLPAPCIIVMQEIFGVNADIRSTCDELARRGFIAVAPDLFWRDAPGLDLNAWSEDEWKHGLELCNAFDLDRGVEDVAATMRAAAHLNGASGSVGVMGFGLGGLMTYLTAARMRVDAAVAYYGGATEQHLEEAGSLNSPLLIHLGDADEFILSAARAAIVKALSGKAQTEIYVYRGCLHAFARHGGAHFDAAAATLANDRTAEFFATHLRR